jgi:TRAP transporter 4TM/12TM fusion protein
VNKVWKEFLAGRSFSHKIGAVTAVVLAVFQIYTALFGVFDALIQRSVHLGLALILVFAFYPSVGAKNDRRRYALLDLFLMVLSGGLCAFILLNYDWLANVRFAAVSPLSIGEVVFGILLFVLVLEGTRRVVGNALVFCVIPFILYPFLGKHLPGVLHTVSLSFSDFLDFQTLTLGGIFGIPLGVSAAEIAQFIIFGAILLSTGGSTLINNLAISVAGKMVGGPAKVAVVASALMGTITGSGTANVATTGCVTIPLMKRAGYSPSFAAAVEATASSGGQIMPPVMGAAAFVMSGLTGIPYVKIIGYAVFPALLYYLSVFTCVHLEAKRMNLPGIAPEMTLKETLRRYGHMIIPIAILVYLLIAGYTPRLAGGYGVVSAIAASFLRPASRLTLSGLLKALEASAKGMLIVVLSCAAAGVIVGSVELTGLGHRLSSAFIEISGGMLILGLFLAMIIAIILGCGMPTTPAYIVQAATVIPALIAMGLPLPVAHMYAFYFACMSLITPPVAPTAYTAAAIAEADGFKTGWIAFRLGIVGFIVPYMFAYSPTMLLIGEWWHVAITVITGAIGVICLAAAGEGYLIQPLKWYERILGLAAAIFLIVPKISFAAPGFAALALLMIIQINRKRGQNGGREQLL